MNFQINSKKQQVTVLKLLRKFLKKVKADTRLELQLT